MSNRAGATREAGEGYLLGQSLLRDTRLGPYRLLPGDPHTRRLSIFTQDPEVFRDGGIDWIDVPYEPLSPGPAGALLRVVDDDGYQRNTPLDLNDPRLLVEGGLEPAPSNPQFHQQMLYALCWWLYCRFRRALGRVLEWGFDPEAAGGFGGLTLRPHDRDAGQNALYDPQSRTLRFGYFAASQEVYGRNIPKTLTFTCLSHDIVMHECTHALLDGLRRKFAIPTGPDVLAFHEGFADLVAILTHFSHRGSVLAAVQARGRDALSTSMLAELAVQFGHTTGSIGALRSAIDADPTKPTVYNAGLETHALGSVLVSAVFEAFTVIWKRRTDPLFLLLGRDAVQASSSPLRMPSELEEMLAELASKIASQFLDICIRAIDYCPVADIELGEYLRALVTADRALITNDRFGYCDALIDAFAARKVYPPNVGSFSEDVLLWSAPAVRIPTISSLSFAELRFDGDPGNPLTGESLSAAANELGILLARQDLLPAFGLASPDDTRLNGDLVGLPIVESIRTCRRVGPDGQVEFDTVIEVTQERQLADLGASTFGGCTMLVDPWGNTRYLISKNVLNETRIAAQRAYIQGAGKSLWSGSGRGEAFQMPSIEGPRFGCSILPQSSGL
jgi:hypothetical protein